MSDDYSFQFSERAGDAIIVVRGNSISEFQQNLYDVADDVLLAAIDAASQGVKSLAPVQTVAQSFPGAQRGAQGGSEGATHSCVHGTRSERSGTKKDGAKWQAFFCPDKKCKPVNPDGTEWK